MITYIEYQFDLSPPTDSMREILIALLLEVRFESFLETDMGLLGYIPEEYWGENILDNLWDDKSLPSKIDYTYRYIAPQNWNAEWERSFLPIVVSGQCMLRASFHPKAPPEISYELIINPKMSFGTGHHQTTYMMIQYLIEEPSKDCQVLDMGCGTGVLAILAEKRGATSIDAIDIDSQCVENSTENISLNNCKYISINQNGYPPKNKVYDLILANINRNTLLSQIPKYKKILRTGGILLMSGYYDSDFDLINDFTILHGLRHCRTISRDNWIATKYQN